MVLRCVFGLATLALLSTVLVAAEPPPARDALDDTLPQGAVARMGNNRFVVVGTLKAIAFAADGKWLAAQSTNLFATVFRCGCFAALFQKYECCLPAFLAG